MHPSIIELHIGELVLHGFQAGDRRGIGAAVEGELTRLLTEGGLPGIAANSVSIERLDAGEIKVATGTKPRMVGTQLARSIHKGLAGQKKPFTKRFAQEARKTR